MDKVTQPSQSSPVSKPQYYGLYGKDHCYVIKLKRVHYPYGHPTHSGVWIGVTAADENRSMARKEAKRLYEDLSKRPIKAHVQFSEEVERLGHHVDYVD